jgi:DNA-binding FadR family transcriptional regulator
MHIAREFNVSQATVREALLQLEQLGLAVRLANRGTMVTRLTPQDARDRLEIRSELDPMACIKAGARMTEDDFAYLGRLAKEISKDYKRESVVGFITPGSRIQIRIQSFTAGMGADVGVNENGHQIGGHKRLKLLMARDGIESPTHGFSAHELEHLRRGNGAN